MLVLTPLKALSSSVSSAEEHGTEASGKQRKPGRIPAQEKPSQGSQWPEPGALQEQFPPPPPVIRPGEQPPLGAHTREEEEEALEQETQNGELKMTVSLKFVMRVEG